ncbi:hypothetical protein HFD88_006142 [Aspergillus terreus]|nr:hypothetical protein HFD88_006142 [Aspergillus terreus]
MRQPQNTDSPVRTAPRRRTRTGCVNCSRRRRKCDEAKPFCTGCKRRGDKCQWRVLGSFRDANIKVLEPEHPSMNQTIGNSNRRQSRFKILNVQPPSPRRSETDGTGSKDQRQQQEDEGEHHLTETPSGAAPAASEIHLDGHSASAVPGNVDNVLNPTPYHPDPSPHSHSPSICTEASFAPAAHHPSSTSVGLSGTANHRTPDHYPCDDPPGQPYMHSSPEEFVVNELTALRDLSGNTAPFAPPSSEPYPTIASPLFDHSVFSDPANFTDNIFVPGSAYEALHTALRNRQLWTARPDIPSRTDSPVSVPGYGVTVDGIRPDAGRHHHRQQPSRGFELSPDRENVLWQNYLNEICLWLDMFDSHRHFASTFPQMAKSAPHLRYSILALSARQIERKQNEKSQSESLSLYQEAIHLLLPELESKTTPVIASCVILCVLEMLSCNPKEWRRHLDGCAYLIQAAEINGFSGKEEQALFWCFARMDVCGGLISEEETIIPIRHWIPKDMTPAEASQLFLTSNVSAFDTYANYTVYLCAQTVGVLFGASTTPQPYLGSPDDADSYVHRWKRLFASVEQWYDNRPNQMKPIFTVGASTEWGSARPFPTVLYGNGAAISGNQLYHTCALLLLQRKPKTLSLPRRPKSVLWHARQICAISASNTHHGCWTNALQPLWLVGKTMSHHSEHAAIVETLTRIERETGWATAWRVEDLRDFWGDDDDVNGVEDSMRMDMEVDVNLQTPRSYGGSR